MHLLVKRILNIIKMHGTTIKIKKEMKLNECCVTTSNFCSDDDTHKHN